MEFYLQLVGFKTLAYGGPTTFVHPQIYTLHSFKKTLQYSCVCVFNQVSVNGQILFFATDCCSERVCTCIFAYNCKCFYSMDS